MIFENKNNYRNNSQSGVTLMLAILVLAAITAVALSLATIVFIEIRSAGDSSRTEPALYATLGVTEEALFQYKKAYEPVRGLELNVPSCFPKGAGVCDINGVTLSMPGTQPIAFDDSPREEFIGANEIKILPMYVMDNYDDQQYDFLQVDVLPNESSSGVDISSNIYYSDQADPVPGFSGVALPGTPFSTTGFQSSGQYELTITNNSSQDLTVSITTERVGDQDPAGLPFVGEQVLRIMASYAGLTRTYQVRIPIP